jgi:hypothetical protein
MKGFTLILSAFCIGLIASSIIPSAHDAAVFGRAFTTAFFKQFTGKDYSLGSDCLGSDFEDNYTRLISAINKENALLTIAVLSDIADDIKENCPITEITEVVKSIETAVQAADFQTKIAAHATDLVKVLKEAINQESLDPILEGKEVAEVAQIVIESGNAVFKFLENVSIVGLKSIIPPAHDAAVFGRSFVSSFFKQYTGKDYSLDADCLGSNFEDKYTRLIAAINKEDALLTIALISDIADDVKAHCPITDITAVVTSIEAAVNSADFATKIVAHATDLIKVLKEAINQETIDPVAQGREVAQISQIVVSAGNFSKKTYGSLKFLQNNNKLTDESAADFLDGLLEGVSSVPVAQNKCKVEAEGVEPQLIQAIQDLVNAVKTGKGFVEAVQEFLSILNEIKAIPADCHFQDLYNDLVALGTTTGILKAVTRVATHAIAFVEDITGFTSNLKSGHFHDSGVAFGKILTLVLNFTTQ